MLIKNNIMYTHFKYIAEHIDDAVIIWLGVTLSIIQNHLIYNNTSPVYLIVYSKMCAHNFIV